MHGLGQDTMTSIEGIVGTNLRRDALIGDTSDNRLWRLGGKFDAVEVPTASTSPRAG